MKKAEQLRHETDKLEKKVKLAVEEFIKEVGDCDLRIDTDMHFVESTTGKFRLLSTGVKVYVTV
tara:strand:- start:618 stop:809 length:192 start_codon:yes stop_codon:yes gene_type:complete